MKVLTAQQAKRADQRAQDEFKMDGFDLMQQAGRAVALRIAQEYPQRGAWCVVCGKGNNGGDGLVIAAELFKLGIMACAVLLAAPETLRNEAAQALEYAHKYVPVYDDLENQLRECDGIIDAVFGIGLRDMPTDQYAQAIKLINASNVPIVAVDVPSGIRDGLTSEDELTHAVHADLTVTIGRPKRAIVTYPGAMCAGRILTEPIQFPPQLWADETLTEHWLAPEEIASLLPKRIANSNKGTYGKLMIVAGCAPYAGAAIFAATGALRMGIGLVTLAATPWLNPIFKIAVPECCTLLAPSTAHDDGFDNESAPTIAQALAGKDALVLGPGLGTAPHREEFVIQMLSEAQLPIVIDADALNALANFDRATILKNRPTNAQWVMTPHPGEAARLLTTTIAQVQADRCGAARTMATQWGATVLLKGAGTVIANAAGHVWHEPYASSVLARGGTGDVLAGVIGGLLAQNIEPTLAAALGARQLALAAERAKTIHGERAVLTREIAAALVTTAEGI